MKHIRISGRIIFLTSLIFAFVLTAHAQVIEESSNNKIIIFDRQKAKIGMEIRSRSEVHEVSTRYRTTRSISAGIGEGQREIEEKVSNARIRAVSGRIKSVTEGLPVKMEIELIEYDELRNEESMPHGVSPKKLKIARRGNDIEIRETNGALAAPSTNAAVAPYLLEVLEPTLFQHVLEGMILTQGEKVDFKKIPSSNGEIDLLEELGNSLFQERRTKWTSGVITLDRIVEDENADQIYGIFLINLRGKRIQREAEDRENFVVGNGVLVLRESDLVAVRKEIRYISRTWETIPAESEDEVVDVVYEIDRVLDEIMGYPPHLPSEVLNYQAPRIKEFQYLP
ncbi:MAG: hypothetical protein JKX97_08280 [Candidatus Lindowbacteria bacterium]|nr:hypothetical protein [Candidatus Lindowbacteria bacterium]